jgi:sRNA-binding carbon storage regulator CsrA
LEANLKVKVGADVQEAVNGLKQVEQSGQNLSKSLGTTVVDSTGKLSNSLNNLSNVSSVVSDDLGALTSALGTGLAGAALIALSYAVRLSEKYGGLSNAIQGAIIGNRDFSISQLALNKELEDGAGKAGVQATELKTLVEQLTNSNSSENERVNAFREIKKEYPGLLEGIDNETKLTAQQNEQLKANADLEIKLIKLKSEKAAVEKVLGDAYTEQARQANEVNKIISKSGNLAGKTDIFFSSIFEGLKSGTFLTGASNPFSKIGSDISNTANDAKFLEDRLKELLAEINKINPQIVNNISSGKSKTLVGQVADDFKYLVQTVSGGGIDALKGDIDAISKLNQIQVGGKAPSAVKAFKTPELEEQIAQTQRLKEAYTGLARQFSGDLTAAVTGFVDALFSGQDAGDALLKGLINAFKNLAIQLVAVVVEATILAALLEEFPALKAIFTAAAPVIDAASKLKIGKHASGGVATSAQIGMVGEAGPEAIIPLSQLSYLTRQMNPQMSGNWSSGGMEVSGVLVGRGNDLLAVVNNANRVANRSF